MYRFPQCRDEADAPAAPASAAPGDTPSIVPQPSGHRGRRRDYRVLFDAELLAALDDSAASGAALEAVAPVDGAPAPASSGRSLLLPLLVIAGIAFL